MLPPYCTRDDIAKLRGKAIILFGDALNKKGECGQSEVCRGFTHCVGIPVKKLPCMDEARSFFRDEEFDLIRDKIDRAVDLAVQFGSELEVPIYVMRGIGTGMSKLNVKAPKIYAYMVQELKKIVDNPEDLI